MKRPIYDKKEFEKVKEGLPVWLKNPNFRMTVIGSTMSGKTYFTLQLLKNFKRYYDILVWFSPTKTDLDEVKKLKVRNPELEPIIERTWNTQDIKDMWDELEKKNQDKMQEDEQPLQSILIIDDFITEKKIFNRHSSTLCDDLYVKGRHENISTIVLSQIYKSGLSKCLRSSNPTYLVVFDVGADELNNIAKEHAPSWLNDKSNREVSKFARFLKSYLSDEKYNHIVIQNRKNIWTDDGVKLTKKIIDDYLSQRDKEEEKKEK